MQLVSARLQDAVEPLPDDRISWRTTWRACFAPADAADDIARWESRVTTTEGASPEVHELPDGCLDIDVASGVSATDSGMPGRDLQLFDAQRLAYQVRLVRPDGTVTPWTDRVLVGTVTPAG